MRSHKILGQLEGGDRRSVGRADEVAALVSRNPKLFPRLFAGLWSDDPLVRMRATDAAEKVTRTAPQLLQPYKAELLGLLAESALGEPEFVESDQQPVQKRVRRSSKQVVQQPIQQEVRWHLAVMVPRLKLIPAEAQRVASQLTVYLEDRSSIVKTFALQGLWELAQQHASVRPLVVELLQLAVRTGTPAMRARARKLLARFAHAG